MKRLILLTLLCLMTGLMAAPVPKPTNKAKIEAIYGDLVDPDGKCDFQLDGTKLTIDLPGGTEYMCYEEKQNAPRLTRTVEGDFIITVKCSADLPNDAEQVEGRWAEVGCGLYIKPKDSKVQRLGLSDFIYLINNKPKHVQVVLQPISYGPSGINFEGTGNSVYVRFSRIGKHTENSYSDDGKTFIKRGWSDTDTGEPYQVGVYGCSNCTKATRAILDDFKLEFPKADKK